MGTITHSYAVSEDYFDEIMIGLGKYLMKRYHETDSVPLTEILGQLMCIKDLTTPQRMYLAAWFGYNRDTYEDKILLYIERDLEF